MKNRSIQTLNDYLKLFWISTSNGIKQYIVRLDFHMINWAFFVSSIEQINLRHDDELIKDFCRKLTNLRLGFLRANQRVENLN